MLDSNVNDTLLKRAKLSFIALLSVMIMLSYVPALANTQNDFPNNVYFVSTTGSDRNLGTLEAPWRTIQYAAKQLKAGETVLVRGGTYEENITIKSSGSADGGYITFRAYPGENPVINAAKLDKSSIVHFTGANYVIFDGFELTGLHSDSSSKYLAAIKVTDSGSNLQIINNHIHHIANVHAKGNANGIVIYGNGTKAISDVTIAGNRLHDLTLGSSEALTIVGNVDGFTVHNNIIYDINNIGIDIAGHYNTCSDSCIDYARNGVVSDNIVYNVDTISNPAYRGVRAAAGIYVDGGTSTIIERNIVYNSNYGIEIASENIGEAAANIILRNNLIYNNHMSGLIMGGSSLHNGSATNNLITNNTFYNNNVMRTGDGEITFQKHVLNNTFINNVFYTNSETPFFYDSNTINYGNKVDYNLYFVNGTLSSHWRVNGTKYYSFEDYTAKTKLDENSIYADPLFVAIEKGNAALMPQSPAINQGTLAYGNTGDLDLMLQDRISGIAIDIGAFEYSNPPKPNVDIKIDGMVDDWAGIDELAISSSNVKTMKAIIVNETLYVLITGNMLNDKGQLYIETGVQTRKAFAVPYWAGHTASYLIENGRVYQYSGDGGSWSWSRVNLPLSEVASINASVVEIAIPLSLLNSDSISIGYIWKDSKTNRLPLEGGMSTVPILVDE